MTEEVGQGVVVSQAQQVLATLAANAESGEETSAKITARILGAETAEELFDGTPTVSSDKHIGVPFWATGVTVRPSGFKETPYYGSIDAEDPVTGMSYVVNSSSETSILKIARAMRIPNALPALLKFTQSTKPTANGYYPVDLVRATQDDLNIHAKALENRGKPLEPTADDPEPF